MGDLLEILLDVLMTGRRGWYRRELDKHDPILTRPTLALGLYASMFLFVAAVAAVVYLRSVSG